MSEPRVEYAADSVTITIGVRPLTGDAKPGQPGDARQGAAAGAPRRPSADRRWPGSAGAGLTARDPVAPRDGDTP